MNDLPVNAHNYQPPVNQLLSLGKPQGQSCTLNYAALGIRSEHVPELLRMASDGGLHNAPRESKLIWAPVHAWRALGELKAEPAIGPLLGLLSRIDEHDDDWASDELPGVLGAIGRGALEPVTAYLANPAHGEWARVAAANAMAKIGARHAELRAECVARLSAQLEKFAEQSETLNAFLVSPLLDLKAREALPLMERAFAAGHVDETVVGDYEDVEIDLGLKPQRENPRKPNELTELGDELRALKASRLKADAILDEAGDQDHVQRFPSPGKAGRNDPCPCGSGKKYKKCCLERDEALARQTRPADLPAIVEDDFTAELLPKVDEAVDRLMIRVEKGQFENVEADLEALLRKHPDYHTTNYAMGVYLAMVREDVESAIPYFQKAVSVFPLMAEAHYNLGTCHIKAGRIPEAVASLRKAIRYSAGDDDHIAEKARDELRSLERILRDGSPFQTLDAYLENQRLFDLAFENLRAQRYEAAVDLFNQVLAQNPDHVQSHGNVALAYAGLGQKAVALKHLDQALALDPTYEPAIQNRRIIEAIKEGEPHRPLAMAETEYYRECLEAEKSPARRGWWQKIKRLTGG